MKYAILILIRFYWVLIPKKKRRKCLHRISCSHFVYEVTKQKGFLEGIKAFKYRYNTCRPNHEVLSLVEEDKIILILADGSVLNQNEISLNILNQYKTK